MCIIVPATKGVGRISAKISMRAHLGDADDGHPVHEAGQSDPQAAAEAEIHHPHLQTTRDDDT